MIIYFVNLCAHENKFILFLMNILAKVVFSRFDCTLLSIVFRGYIISQLQYKAEQI